MKMRYKNAKMFVVYAHDNKKNYESTCEVTIGDSEIAISCDENGLAVTYSGPEVASGHYDLTNTVDVKARSSLHRFPDSNIFEGSWKDSKTPKGFWTIELRQGEKIPG